ncbi:MAG TPA: ATP-binding protein, partial [Bacteroidota bacterium]|nr:ATP-binding protein [Bacteroidota bacterium]
FNSISHEMRTPITALISASEGLLNDAVGQQQELRRELAAEVQEAANRLDHIVQNLLAMARFESGLIKPKLDWCDIRDVINSSIGKMKNDLAHHPVHVDIAEPAPLMKLDFGLMEQVLLNLLRNASEYTPSGSTIRIGVQTNERECILTVTDNGPGFPAESLGKVFDKFYRVPGSKTGGLGLGLSISSGFVRAHHGNISVENQPDGGARFTIQLPINERTTIPGEVVDG